MKFQNQWVVPLLLATLLFGCESKTSGGYPYDIYKDMGQPVAEVGDEVFAYIEMRTTDTLLFVSPDVNGMSTVLVDPKLNHVRNTGPIADVLPLLGEGDSAVVRAPVTESMRVAAGLETVDEIYYHVVVRKINKPGSEAFGKTNAQSSGNKAATQAIDAPNIRAKLKAEGKGLEELRVLAQFTGHALTNLPDLKTTKEGLVYRIIEAGNGGEIKAAESIEINYLGSLADGTVFAETFTSDLPFSFPYQEGRVIKGWDIGLDLIQKGGVLLLAVPPKLAYGRMGKAPYIDSNETLYYYLEVLE